MIMLVGQRETNVFDQLALLDDLAQQESRCMVRLTFSDLASSTKKDSSSGTLFWYIYTLYMRVCVCVSLFLFTRNELHVSVVYFRTGYSPSDYPSEKVRLIMYIL
jgi:hypothetical protein